jgi:hypothetical protein
MQSIERVLSMRILSLAQVFSLIAMGLAAVVAWPVLAAPPPTLTFVTHASFFSEESHQQKPLDPQVFVRAADAAEAAGPQGIHHIAGFEPALLSGAPGTPLFSAPGKPLGFTLAEWLAAEGTVTITELPSGRARIVAHFTGLRPNGVYSLFENHFDQQPVGFTPLDGAGNHNSFRAGRNGTATVTVMAPGMLTHANAVLLVYHSDFKTHGASRGDPGVTAHHQLIARLP